MEILDTVQPCLLANYAWQQ